MFEFTFTIQRYNSIYQEYIENPTEERIKNCILDLAENDSLQMLYYPDISERSNFEHLNIRRGSKSRYDIRHIKSVNYKTIEKRLHASFWNWNLTTIEFMYGNGEEYLFPFFKTVDFSEAIEVAIYFFNYKSINNKKNWKRYLLI